MEYQDMPFKSPKRRILMLSTFQIGKKKSGRPLKLVIKEERKLVRLSVSDPKLTAHKII